MSGVQEAKPEVRLSARELAEYYCAQGDLMAARASIRRALEGAAAHRRLQAEQEEGYLKEVPLSVTLERSEYMLTVEGRADGIVPLAAQVHEIKTTYLPLEELDWEHYPAYHAQLWIYGFIYALDKGLSGVSLRLTYYQMQNGKTRDFITQASFEELCTRFNAMVEDYARISDETVRHGQRRDVSLAELQFPFPKYRPSQLDMAQQVYMAVKNKKTLYVQAPTGTGKTAATLFPALKALGTGLCRRVFYCTAKEQTAEAAVRALELMRRGGLRLKSICIAAKDKACLMEKRECDPEKCPYCRDYEIKQHEYLPQILAEDAFSPARVRELGEKYGLCPFELSLKISEYCDCIICDYNYAFHPSIRFRRYFQNSRRDSVFLVDEAHNLAERTRDIFSAKINPAMIARLRRELEDFPALSGLLRRLEGQLKGLCRGREEQGFLLEQPPAAVYAAAAQIMEKLGEESEHPLPPAAAELSRLLSDFMMVFEHYRPEYHRCYVLAADCSLHLLCVHTGAFVRKTLELARASVLFSATLSPHEYYMYMLGADENSYYFELPYPFDPDNLLVVADDGINTAYSARAQACLPIAKRIRATIRIKKGNYIVFFPSYAFLNGVLKEFRALCPQVPVAVHVPNMSRRDKESFISRFENEEGVVGFSVLGGHFGEGVDLPGERLIGAVIVGVGLPQLSPERNLIKEYFDSIDMDGYGYAYVYPGLNRVLQAAGRVIRTDTDRGVVLLIDSRYARPPYTELMPQEWQMHYLSQEERSYRDLLEDFWE